MRYPTLAIFLALWLPLSATNLSISDPIYYLEKEEVYAVFNVSWENAWHNERNNDAVWLFMKGLSASGEFHHINVAKAGHEVVESFSSTKPRLKFEVPFDQVGVFVFPAVSFRGNIESTIKLRLDPKSFENLNTRELKLVAHGIEMVGIPEGRFFLGDADTTALNYGSIYAPGEPNVSVELHSENQVLQVSSVGDLYYRAPEGYEGDQKVLPVFTS